MVCVIQIAELTVVGEDFRQAAVLEGCGQCGMKRRYLAPRRLLLLCEVVVLVDQHGGGVCQKGYVS